VIASASLLAPSVYATKVTPTNFANRSASGVRVAAMSTTLSRGFAARSFAATRYPLSWSRHSGSTTTLGLRARTAQVILSLTGSVMMSQFSV